MSLLFSSVLALEGFELTLDPVDFNSFTLLSFLVLLLFRSVGVFVVFTIGVDSLGLFSLPSFKEDDDGNGDRPSVGVLHEDFTEFAVELGLIDRFSLGDRPPVDDLLVYFSSNMFT